ncbi:hypothetical protein CKAN_00862900 [Cinnamomum micranthum f. kanehirae]|uniref:Uncharacterized protein n=1 Tax=Cinnamomum micranthum f. kanehirae TaxID=337451 RepID=A0A443NNC5_9MAGN|nr:hypothetical protein CKAN_00862900 [Cinnamomum micranthum f. kanehirae]
MAWKKVAAAPFLPRTSLPVDKHPHHDHHLPLPRKPSPSRPQPSHPLPGAEPPSPPSPRRPHPPLPLIIYISRSLSILRRTSLHSLSPSLITLIASQKPRPAAPISISISIFFLPPQTSPSPFLSHASPSSHLSLHYRPISQPPLRIKHLHRPSRSLIYPHHLRPIPATHSPSPSAIHQKTSASLSSPSASLSVCHLLCLCLSGISQLTHALVVKAEDEAPSASGVTLVCHLRHSSTPFARHFGAS